MFVISARSHGDCVGASHSKILRDLGSVRRKRIGGQTGIDSPSVGEHVSLCLSADCRFTDGYMDTKRKTS